MGPVNSNLTARAGLHPGGTGPDQTILPVDVSAAPAIKIPSRPVSRLRGLNLVEFKTLSEISPARAETQVLGPAVYGLPAGIRSLAADISQRIYRRAVYSYLKVAVVSGTAAGAAHLCDDLTLVNLIAY